MRNLNKFITGTDYLAYVNNGKVVAVEYENVVVKVTRDSVNEYEVKFIRNDRTYSHKCQTQKDVIETIKNDIAYHDSVAKETANENEFADFEKPLNETEEFKEIISAHNAHMSNADRLQAAISRTFGADVTVVKSNERFLLIRYDNEGSAEFATFRHDWDSVYSGNCFTAWGVDENDFSNEYFIKARNIAIADYYARTEKDNINILGRR